MEEEIIVAPTPQELESMLRDPLMGHKTLKPDDRLHIIRMMHGHVRPSRGGFNIHAIPGCLKIVLGNGKCSCGQRGPVKLYGTGSAGSLPTEKLESLGWTDEQVKLFLSKAVQRSEVVEARA